MIQLTESLRKRMWILLIPILGVSSLMGLLLTLRWNGGALSLLQGQRASLVGIPTALGLFFMVRAALPHPKLHEKSQKACGLLGFSLLLSALLLKSSQIQSWSLPGWNTGDTGQLVSGIVLFGCFLWSGWQFWRTEKVPKAAGFLFYGLLVLPLLHTQTSGFHQSLFLICTLLGLWVIPHWDTLRAEHPQASVSSERTLVAFLVLGFLLLKMQGMGASASDENIYFYDAHLISKGLLPYRDFFFAHPPLHLLFPAILFSIFEFSLPLAKAISPLIGLSTGLILWRVMRENSGRTTGILALFFFLFAAETLKATTNLTGVNSTLLFFAGGLWAAQKRRNGLSGALLGLSLCTGFYMAAPVLTVLLWGLITEKKQKWKGLLAFVATFGAINLIGWGVGGREFIDGVYTYHFLKPAKESARLSILGDQGMGLRAIWHNFTEVFLSSKEFLSQVYFHGEAWLLAAIAPLVLLISAQKTPLKQWFRPSALHQKHAGSTVVLLFGITSSLFVEFSLFQELHSHYFALLLLSTAGLTAWTLGHIWQKWNEDSPATNFSRPLLGVLFFTTVACMGSTRQEAAFEAWPSEKQKVGESVEFSWSESPLAPELDFLTRGLFWKETRIRGEEQHASAHYLWSKKRWFSTASAIADEVRKGTQSHSTLGGASTVAPLIALLSGRSIAAHEVDTNTKRFRSGLLSTQTYFERICRTPLVYIVGTARSFFSQKHLAQLPVIQKYFTLAKRYTDPALKNGGAQRFELYKIREEGEPCLWH